MHDINRPAIVDGDTSTEAVVAALRATVERLPEQSKKASMRGLLTAAAQQQLNGEALRHVVCRLRHMADAWADEDPLVRLREELARLLESPERVRY